MNVQARCRHCAKERTWERLPSGDLAAPLVDVGAGAKRYVYPCAVVGDRGCEPHVEGVSRMTRELAGGIGKRFAGSGRSAKRR